MVLSPGKHNIFLPSFIISRISYEKETAESPPLYHSFFANVFNSTPYQTKDRPTRTTNPTFFR